MNLKRLPAIPISILILWLLAGSGTLAAPFVPLTPQYLFPRPGSQSASPQTTMALRLGEPIAAASLRHDLFSAVGSRSGVHAGAVLLAADGETVIFRPERPFAAEEWVEIRVMGGIRTRRGDETNALSWRFRTAEQDSTVTAARLEEFFGADIPASAHAPGPAAPDRPPDAPPSAYLTLPADFPDLRVTTNSGNSGRGYVFLAPHHKNWLEAKPYLLIIDDDGEPVFARKMSDGRPVQDFKRQPGGLLTYWDAADGKHHALDDHYNLVETYTPGHGYHADFHDFQLLPNGNALFLIWTTQVVDMSEIVDGGRPDALVTSAVIQEMDGDGNVLFEWHGLDHLPITDAAGDLTAAHIDYMHTNAVEQDFDGNLLISSRHLSEVTKINRQTGEIMWRLGGGRGNQFTFIDDPDHGFLQQHDVRRLPNGHITLFDNRGGGYSRAVEYALDTEAMTATLVWEFQGEPGNHAFIMGSTQRLPGGNTLIDWASVWRAETGWTGEYPLITEATAAAEKIWELTVDVPIFSYRAFRFPWVGRPDTEPALVVDVRDDDTVLTYSWNGATEVAAWRVYGDLNDFPTTLLAVQPKTGFETQTRVAGVADPAYRYRVVPLNAAGKPLIPDPTATPAPTPPPSALYLPLFVRESAAAATTTAAQAVPARYITAPADLPTFSVIQSGETAEGYIFIAPYERRIGGTPYSPYLLIIANDGELVYHQRVPAAAEDFKRQGEGVLSYTIGGSFVHVVMDASYSITETVTATDGYRADFHDFQIMADGHRFLLIFEPREIDMSQIVSGGAPDATVIGCRIQEFDENGALVFEWSSFDHFDITDTTKSLYDQHIDYVHCNAIDRDDDGNLLLSSRDMDEITKIDGESGDILWRLGGKNNEFQFINQVGAQDVGFVKQHDARWTASNRITLFDNRLGAGNYSRAIEYELDETRKIAKLVWEFRNAPDIHSPIMGNAQRLPNGNTLIGWGSGHPAVTESRPDGTKVFELALDSSLNSYRAFRFAWTGRPDTDPDLVVQIQPPDTLLAYSWNGATEAAAWRVYGDLSDFPTTLLAVQPKTGFETTTLVAGVADPAYHFRVVPLDASGQPLRPDPVTITPTATRTPRPTKTVTPPPVPDIFLPMVSASS